MDGHKWSWKKFWHAAVGIVVGIVATVALGPAGLAWYGSTMAGVIGGALGGAISGGLDGGWQGALIGGAIGGALGGLGGKILGGSPAASSGGNQLADASVDLGVITITRDAGGSALGDAIANAAASGASGVTAGQVLSSAFASAVGGVAGAAGAVASSISSAASYLAYESVVPGPFGQPVSEWQGGRPTSWGDPMKYTERAGGGWLVAERTAVAASAALAVGAGGLIALEAMGTNYVGALSKHAMERMWQRNIPISRMNQIIKQGTQYYDPLNNSITSIYGDGVVARVLSNNPWGRIIKTIYEGQTKIPARLFNLN